MSKYTHEFCKQVLEAFHNLYRAKDAVEDIKSELDPTTLHVWSVGPLDLLKSSSNFNKGYNKKFAAFLDDIGADEELRGLIENQDGGPVGESEIDIIFLKEEVSALKSEVSELRERGDNS